MPNARDGFIDGLRAISVLRVISLHLLQHIEHPFLVVFSFFMPGMPLMFFVSGALAAQSLAKPGNEVRRRFWKTRGRRLMLPFWAFGACVLGFCVLASLWFGDAAHAVDWSIAWRWVLPLAGPQASPAYDRLDWHLWFLSSLILMLALAPWTLALHRRAPWLVAGAFLASGAALELAAWPVPDVVRNALLFGACFQLGYGFADGRLARMRARWLFAIAAALAACAWLVYAQRAFGAMLHEAPLALVALGLAFVAVWNAVRPAATRVFEHPRLRGWIGAINRRAYTLFLWGPVANEVARRIVRPANQVELAIELCLAIALLCACARLFGAVEDWAARRGRKLEFERAAAPAGRQAA